MKKKKELSKNDLLRNWLREHDLFNLAALCRRIDYNRGAFSHWLEGNAGWDIGEEAAQRLESVLINYGYKKQA